MEKRRLNNWRRWLQTCSLGLLIFAAFAPLSETPHKILLLLASVGTLTFLIIDSPTSRKEAARSLIPLAALVLLALLVSIDPKWVFFGFIGVFAATCLWDVYKLEHAEYLAKRKHLR
jgi:hypothetical protein